MPGLLLVHLDTYIHPHQYTQFYRCYFYHYCYHCCYFTNIEHHHSIDKTVISNVEEVMPNADDEMGHIFKIDLEYSARVHDEPFDVPLALDRWFVQAECFPEKQKTIYSHSYGKRSFNFRQKLIPNLFKEIGYAMHQRNLRQCLEMDFVVTRVYAVVTFNRFPWLHEHIDFNTDKRAHAKNDFAKTVFKLMNNAVFRKTMANVREHKMYDAPSYSQQLCKLVQMLLHFNGVIEVDKETLIVERNLKRVKLMKPIDV